MGDRRFTVRLTTTHIIMLSFLGAIFIGTILLALPVSAAGGNAVPFIDALFTATSACCVTGLVTVTTADTWSIFGQLVILCLIQVGGLGIVTILYGVMIGIHRKMGIGARMLLLDAFNLNTLSGIIGFTKKVIFGTLIVEGIGALLCMLVFVPEYGPRGIWISVFHAISAFCNAGMDVIGPDSLCPYVTNPLINLVTMLLIILGGLGFIVWWDVLRVRCFRRLTLHSKLAIVATCVLLVAGTIGYLVFEWNNPATLGGISDPGKLMAAAFQSVTVRTAGFATIAQENWRDSSVLLSMVLMFIGGSPVGTAGGVKTVTMLVVFACALSTIRNKEDVNLFDRVVPKYIIMKAIAVICVAFSVVFGSALLLSAVMEADLIDVMYETVSAAATVGLSRGLTGLLNMPGKLILIVTMYLGRIGPISLAVAFSTKRTKANRVKNPSEQISVG